MKISIITPTLNSLIYLPKCAESIINKQDYTEFEWIIVDGGSKDGTIDFLKKINSDKIKIFTENSGHSTKAYNFGISKAEGEIIGTLGSDDIYTPNIFSKVISYFINNKSNWIVGRNEIIDQNNNKIRQLVTNFKNNQLNNYSYKNLTLNNFFPMQSIFWKKEFMPKKLGYFDEKNFVDSSDYDMWLKMAKIEKPLIVKDIFSNFRVHKTNITSKGSVKQMKQMAEISIFYGEFSKIQKIFVHLKSFLIILIYRFSNFFKKKN